MNDKTEAPEAAKVWKPLPPQEPEIMRDGRLKHSGEQLDKRIKSLMKTHDLMDGSGHLILKELHRPEKWEIKDVQRYVRAGLDEQNVFYLRKKVDGIINRALMNLARPNRGKPIKQPRKRKGDNRERPERQQRQDVQRGQVTRTIYVIQRRGRPYVTNPGGEK
ncbi:MULTISPECIES: hypothetical protein [Acidithiobacillus]|uniref:Uncharacterized protein n=2 Tax=Acidithiobacillus TaxID=119977 RepID=A0A179BBQ9_ACIFR|nr:MULTISPECIES: hypothetical protein [Acidithiobacillus]MEB8486764.1 hypothetical protein [Acidithiobacillus ferriphilus]MEB8488647.1 hypothetical protein [Acidithiobacillus ferriphilus]MEB8493274.1 hypothetical protein [Acidithiobacillus ferriphilus]MEB8513687.1 hypothetical protein [Acidithiobacillus ferriphilus]MEB8522700.1 hypothetical protein [Acidithiobacillus ferriphilus]